MIHGKTVVFYEWMFFQRRRFAGRPIERRAFSARSFDKDGHDCRRDIPAEGLRRRVEKIAVTLRCRQELDILKSAHIHAEPSGVFEKKLGMRPPGDQTA